MYSIVSIAFNWWLNREAKRNPDKNTEDIVKDFLKRHNIDAIVTIRDDIKGSKAGFVTKQEKERIMKKLDKLPDNKKQEIIKSIEAETGFTVDQIKDQIVSPPNLALALHEAGHAVDFKNNTKLKQELRDTASGLALGGSLLAPKASLPILVIGNAPTLTQEMKASIIAYKELERLYGKKEAMKRAKVLWPGMATNIAHIAEMYAMVKVFDKYILKKKS